MASRTLQTLFINNYSLILLDDTRRTSLPSLQTVLNAPISMSSTAEVMASLDVAENIFFVPLAIIKIVPTSLSESSVAFCNLHTGIQLYF